MLELKIEIHPTDCVGKAGVRDLIECSSTLRRSTQTRNLLIFDGELVVISYLLINVYVSFRIDDNLLLRLKGDYLGVTIRLKR